MNPQLLWHLVPVISSLSESKAVLCLPPNSALFFMEIKASAVSSPADGWGSTKSLCRDKQG